MVGKCWSKGDSDKVAIPLIDGQEAIYNVPDEFKVAKMDASRVAEIIQKRKKKRKEEGSGCRFRCKWLMDLWTPSRGMVITRRLLGVPALFLFFYYVVQVNYQLDDTIGFMCPGGNASSATPAPVDGGNPKCREWMKKTFDENSLNYSTITKLITFLLGFYVTNIINRWWHKVRSIPKVENPNLVLCGLTWEEEGAKTEDLTSPPAVAEAKKMVARYCLLSWAMCLTTISNSFADTVGTTKALKERGLLTEDELAALQAPEGKSGPEDNFLADLWWVPLTWTTNLLSRMGVNAEKAKRIIPKDHKDVISSVQKFKKELENQKTCGDHRLPSFYKTICCQQTSHHAEQQASMAVMLVANFPATAILVQTILLGWLYMADILENPYGTHPKYDIDLDEELELNIWRCSVTLQHQNVSNVATEEEREKLRKKIWEVIKPAPAS